MNPFRLLFSVLALPFKALAWVVNIVGWALCICVCLLGLSIAYNSHTPTNQTLKPFVDTVKSIAPGISRKAKQAGQAVGLVKKPVPPPPPEGLGERAYKRIKLRLSELPGRTKQDAKAAAGYIIDTLIDALVKPVIIACAVGVIGYLGWFRRG